MQHGPALRRVLVGLTLAAASGAATGAAPGTAHAAPDAAPRPGFTGGFGEYLSGRFAAEESDLDAASDRLLRALATSPRDTDLLQQTFLVCALAGRPEASRLAPSLGNSQAAAMLLGNEAARTARWDAAESRFASLGHDGLAQVLQPLLVAWAQQGGGRTEAALATLRPYEGGSHGAVFALHAAMIADLAGRTVEAARLYGVARTAYGEMNLRLAQVLASWQARSGRPADVQATLNTLMAAAPDLAIARSGLQAGAGVRTVARATDGMAEAYLAVAASLRQQETPDTAMLMLRYALTLRPDFSPARLLMAEMQAGSKHVDAALATLAAVPPGDPLANVVRLRRASLLARAGDADGAERDLETLARDVPDSPAPLALEADLLREDGRFPEAVHAYDAALARVRDPGTVNWSLFYARGMAYDHAHDWAHAQADFEHALQLSPDEPSVLNYLGYSWTEQGRDLARARQMIARALEARPNEGSIVDSLGWVELHQGQVGEAVETLTRAVELEPEDPVINAHLGDADQAAGDRLDAAYQWQLALTFHPSPEDAAALQAKLRALPPEVTAQPAQAEQQAGQAGAGAPAPSRMQ